MTRKVLHTSYVDFLDNAKAPEPTLEETVLALNARDRYHLLAALEGMVSAKFKIGDRVAKIGGDYTLIGTVRAVYLTGRRRVRYVVEPDMYGLQLIFSAKVLTAVTKDDEAAIGDMGVPQPAPEEVPVSEPAETSASVAKTRLATKARKGRKGTAGKAPRGARGTRKRTRG